MGELPVTIAFFSLCALSGKFVYRHGKNMLSQYQKSVIDQFHEAEKLLVEAKELLAKAHTERKFMHQKVHEIKELSREQARSTLEKGQITAKEIQQSYKTLTDQQSDAFIRQWKKTIILQLCDALFQNVCQNLNKKSNSFDFMEIFLSKPAFAKFFKNQSPS